jgi:acetyl-CoA carboxylase biotin carboxylase subunit
VRVDSALYAGYTVPPHYDSLIAKLVVHDVDRGQAIRRLERALAEYVIDGMPTSLPLLRALVASEEVRSGRFDTRWLGQFLQGWRG